MATIFQFSFNQVKKVSFYWVNKYPTQSRRLAIYFLWVRCMLRSKQSIKIMNFGCHNNLLMNTNKFFYLSNNIKRSLDFGRWNQQMETWFGFKFSCSILAMMSKESTVFLEKTLYYYESSLKWRIIQDLQSLVDVVVSKSFLQIKISVKWIIRLLWDDNLE